MPNLAFHLTVLDQVIDNLVGQNDSRGIVMKNNPQFAALGALGPDLLNYLPISKDLSAALDNLVLTNDPNKPHQISELPIALLSELFLDPLGASYALLFREVVVPTWPAFNSIKALLDKLDAIAQSESNTAALEAIGDIQTMQDQSAILSTLPKILPNLVWIVGQITALSPWMEQTSVFPLPPADIRGNRASEFLRWHRTGAFARNLLTGATTDQQQAYALGWLCHVAASVTGEPFVNNIVGGPYRTHWWRNHLVCNSIDSWAFGFFNTTNASMSGDNPTPLYASWAPVCSANLQDRINVGTLADSSGNDVPDAVKCVATGNIGGLLGSFPSDLADLLASTVTTTYAGMTLPIADLSADAFRRAYIGAFATFWFLTSGSGPMCDNPLGGPPSTCTTPPSWVNMGNGPSPQQAGVNTPGEVCAIILAIIAVLLILVGDYPLAFAAIIALLNAPVIDWAKLRCTLFWLRKQLVDGENALRDLLVIGGLAYPPPARLGTGPDIFGNTIPLADKTPPNGVPLCRTNALGGGDLFKPEEYPRQLDTTQQSAADLNFQSFPAVAVEIPRTHNLIAAGQYPNIAVNGVGLSNGGLLANGTYPSRYQIFGDAVSNALQLITNDGAGLPDYNLDGDRGYGWKGWHPKAGTVPANQPVMDEQDS
jgi:hypothetical protein